MSEQSPDTTPLAALSSDERTQAIQRYQTLQPFLEHAMLLTDIARHHGMA